jgi:hypothetical protein
MPKKITTIEIITSIWYLIIHLYLLNIMSPFLRAFYLYIHTYTYIYIYIHTHTYMYIHTHINIHINMYLSEKALLFFPWPPPTNSSLQWDDHVPYLINHSSLSFLSHFPMIPIVHIFHTLFLFKRTIHIMYVLCGEIDSQSVSRKLFF